MRRGAWLLAGCIWGCGASSTPVEEDRDARPTATPAPDGSTSPTSALAASTSAVSAPSVTGPVLASAQVTAAPQTTGAAVLDGPCENFLFQEGLTTQKAGRKGGKLFTLKSLRLAATMPTSDFVQSNLASVDQALLDCGTSAIRVARAGGSYPSTFEEMESKANLWDATQIAKKELDGGVALVAEGKNPDAAFMYFALRDVGEKKIFCEVTAKSAAARDRLATVCGALKAGK